jgi:hypothetical protein
VLVLYEKVYCIFACPFDCGGCFGGCQEKRFDVGGRGMFLPRLRSWRLWKVLQWMERL